VTYTLLNRADLPGDGSTFDFEGALYDTDVSFIWVDMQPGETVRLHSHPYKEVFIIQEGQSTFTIGDETLIAHAGQIIVAPADVPHKFINSGTTPLRQIDLHLARDIITHWLED
jgi:mannose-6-phosphate isomerase-like protein (cupin superfamily)